VELLQNTPKHVPIYEADATIMYLGVLVDTNRFKMHTSARTFETVAQLRSWGANAQVAEKALCEDLDLFQKKNEMVSSGKLYKDKYMILYVAKAGQPHHYVPGQRCHASHQRSSGFLYHRTRCSQPESNCHLG